MPTIFCAATTKEEPATAKKGMKRPGYTGPEAQNQNPTANPQNSTGKDAKNKSNPNQTY